MNVCVNTGAQPPSFLGSQRLLLLSVPRRGSAKREEKCWCSLFLLFILCPPVFSQAITAADYGNHGFLNVPSTVPEQPVAPLQLATDDQTPSAPRQTSARPVPKPYGWHIAIYPALAWAPIFGTSVTLPPVPSQPIETPGPSASTSSSLNGAFFGGARVEKGKWSVDGLFMWAALSGQRKTPFAEVHLDFVFGNAMVGREVLPNLYVEGGVRRLSLDLQAKVETSSASASPGFWDPLVALTYRRPLGRKWRILIHGDGGGFGVGSDVDVTATARVEWQFARHFGIAMGYGGMHFSESDTVGGRTLTISPTLHGPIFGVGIFF